ncbi:MAG: sensor histidine kinase, partial [Promethearchaeota archaeon]
TFIDSEGKKKAIIVSRDITERKNIESKLKDQNTELEKLNELKSEFLRRATHELKTPLVAIKGYTDLLVNLCDKQDNSEVKINLQNILSGCNRLEHIIKNILESSKLKSSKIRLIKRRENLTNLIKSCIEEQKELCNSRNHNIELNLKENLLLNIDKEQIYEAFTNLLRNAIIYTPPNGIIHIQAKVENGSVITSIKDNGVGFTRKEKKQIFQQFGKINRTDLGLDLGIEGSGLGLFITKKIIDAHSGQIWVESEGRNKGSTVSFSLPKK